jgi:hypothetical protein
MRKQSKISQVDLHCTRTIPKIIRISTRHNYKQGQVLESEHRNKSMNNASKRNRKVTLPPRTEDITSSKQIFDNW